MLNHQVIFQKRPRGAIGPAAFARRSHEVAALEDGQVLIANHYLSLDPYMRMHMLGNDAEKNLGQPLEGRVVGIVEASRHQAFKEGDPVFAMGRWEGYSILSGDNVRAIDIGRVPMPAYLDVLGFTGLTAYVGLEYYCAPSRGETLFISAASGAVGSVAGQIAKMYGLRVMGCAGSDEKVAYLTSELGFEGAFNYRQVPDLDAAVAQLCPEGVDIDFENVGGKIFDAVFHNLNHNGRVAVCGGISQYNLHKPQPAVPNILDFITKRLVMRGFSVRDHMDEIGPYIEKASDWVREGKLTARRTIVDGLERAPEAFCGLFKGENFGKLMIKIGDHDL